MNAMKQWSTLFITAVFASVATVGVTAADKPADKKAATDEHFRPFRGTIKSVDKGGRTITLEGEKAQTFAIVPETKISKDGKPAAFADLVAGEMVGGRAKESADGKWTAVTVNAGKRPAAQPAEKEKK
jgi:uncharacterized lipoprotein NlpE involved in copper resistance